MIEPSAVTNIRSVDQYETILRDSARAQNGVNDIIVIKFYKRTCPHCTHIQPYYEDWAKKDRGYVSSYQVETSEQPEIARLEGIRRVPDFIVYVYGRRRDDLRVTTSDENELERLYDILHNIHRDRINRP